MHREGNVYDEIDKTIIDIMIDYDIKEFPIDEKLVCKRLGVSLVPYSSLDDSDDSVLQKQSEDAFFVPQLKDRPPTIYYNDRIENEGRKRFSIFHEIKHYVFEDKDDSEDDLADHFARFFMCPVPYLILKGITTPEEIMSFCDVSYTAACNVRKSINNRKHYHGHTVFDYEVKLINHIEPVLVEVYKLDDSEVVRLNEIKKH